MFEQIISLAKRIKQELAFYRRVAQHVGTPWLAKVCLGLAIGYLLLPFDLIPDFIPILGQLDDLSSYRCWFIWRLQLLQKRSSTVVDKQ